MLIAIHGVKHYMKRHAHCYTWSEALCSMPCNGEAICSLL